MAGITTSAHGVFLNPDTSCDRGIRVGKHMDRRAVRRSQ